MLMVTLSVHSSRIDFSHGFLIAYFTAASQHPPKRVKFDFFLVHCLNCSIFYSSFLSRPWISSRAKVRLLEWKGRVDLLMYVARHVPKLDLSEITNYPITRDWNQLFHAGITHPEDDSHVVKLLRAIANGERVCKPFEGENAGTVSFAFQKDMWLKFGNMGECQLPC